jgi:hypothetical protein
MTWIVFFIVFLSGQPHISYGEFLSLEECERAVADAEIAVRAQYREAQFSHECREVKP